MLRLQQAQAYRSLNNVVSSDLVSVPMGSTIYIEKPWVLNSALTVLRLQQLNSVVFSDSVSVVAWTRWFVSK